MITNLNIPKQRLEVVGNGWNTSTSNHFQPSWTEKASTAPTNAERLESWKGWTAFVVTKFRHATYKRRANHHGIG